MDNKTGGGVDAAVEALGHIADLVNREVAVLLEATAVRPPASYTVIGVFSDNEPIPVAVIVGDHHVHDGATVFERGLWSTSVLAPDSTTAQQLAVAQLRQR
jgi:threonine dehydrogenase-like Zn-dependent dehydrogenase